MGVIVDVAVRVAVRVAVGVLVGVEVKVGGGAEVRARYDPARYPLGRPGMATG